MNCVSFLDDFSAESHVYAVQIPEFHIAGWSMERYVRKVIPLVGPTPTLTTCVAKPMKNRGLHLGRILCSGMSANALLQVVQSA